MLQLFNKNFKYICILKAFLLLINFKISHADDWELVTKGINGHSFYVLGNEVVEKDNYIYFWQLIDYKISDEYGDSSARIFIKGNCNNLSFKWLKIAYHKENMAKDNVVIQEPSIQTSDWQFSKLNTTSRVVLEFACRRKALLL